MRISPIAVIMAGTLLALASPGRASPTHADLPAPASAAISEARNTCSAGVRAQPGFVVQKDVTGDGIADVVLDYSYLSCGEDPNFWCGTGGCVVQIFASRGGAFTSVYAGLVRAFRFRTVANEPRLFVSQHGSACNRDGTHTCETTLAWDGQAFRVSHRP